MEPDELRLIMVIHFCLGYMERPYCKTRERMAKGVIRNVGALIGQDDVAWVEMGTLMIRLMGWKERPVSKQKRESLWDQIWDTFQEIAKSFFDSDMWDEYEVDNDEMDCG